MSIHRELSLHRISPYFLSDVAVQEIVSTRDRTFMQSISNLLQLFVAGSEHFLNLKKFVFKWARTDGRQRSESSNFTDKVSQIMRIARYSFELYLMHCNMLPKQLPCDMQTTAEIVGWTCSYSTK